MSDLVERLKALASGMGSFGSIEKEAAAYITRLEAELAASQARVKALEEALRPFRDLCEEIETSAAEYDEGDAARNPENWAMSCTWEDLRRARDVLDGK